MEQQTDTVRLDPNQSENGKYNLIAGWLNKIQKLFFCVQYESSGMGFSALLDGGVMEGRCWLGFPYQIFRTCKFADQKRRFQTSPCNPNKFSHFMMLFFSQE